MRCVIQRVSAASLAVDEGGAERAHAAIGLGLVALLGIEQDDSDRDLAWMVGKIPTLRVFPDDAGKMNRSLLDLAAAGEPGLLLVPNFTVAGRAHKERRPDFTTAKAPGEASAMFDRIVEAIRGASPGVTVVSGVFGAHMHVRLENDGPVTIWLDSRA